MRPSSGFITVIVLGVLALSLGAASCSKNSSDEVLAKMAQFKQDACACQDERCVDRVEQAVRAYQKAALESLRDETASDQFMNQMLAISEEMADCAAKHQLDAATKFVFEGLKQDLPGVQAKLAKGDVDMTDCAAINAATENAALLKVAPTRADIAAAVAEGKTLCHETIPLHILEAETKQAEAARAANPTNKAPLPACTSAAFVMARQAASKTPTIDEQAKAIEARYLAACPKT